MARTPIVAGNWKMHKTVLEAVELVNALVDKLENVKGVETVVCPPFTALWPVRQALADTNIQLGAQNIFWEAQGAWTSQIAPGMLTDVGCKYVIIGHSETRGRFGTVTEDLQKVLSYFSETDETINKKVKTALAAGLTPIVCCGELLEERKAGKTDDVVRKQITADLAGLTPEQAAGIVIAYEPVWAIGTGEVCDSPEANRVCGVIRATVKDIFGAEAAESVRIQYGGSVKPDNSAELLHQPEIDGALVGGASLKADDFVAIVKSAL
ncbi:MAG TPA: triose-phosphate isomerase [Armatimonadota bacterium]|nr:triose-phosphate isomerase [Armatimonadota bacterium]HOM71668.1 triose-phosphate isomerase [Armatimonadota bacterium]HOP78991.1 triose-phosphate isomerase [Armatimonadota bacterium]HPP73885.1 triose-phosphate isomerase [Armatimonadota bacterium]